MTGIVPRDIVEAFCRAYASHDIAKIAPFLDDDVSWVISGPVDVLPYCGSHRGKTSVLDMVGRQIPELLQIYGFAPEMVVVDGDRASTLVRLSARRIDDSRPISYRVANFMRFRAGKIIENLSLIDSFDAAEQVLGRPLPVDQVEQVEQVDAGDLFAV